MKKVVFLCFLSLLIGPLTFADRENVESKITDVIVYPGSAVISRTVDVHLSKGNNQIILSDIVQTFSEHTLRVSVLSNNKAKVLGAKVITRYLKEVPVERVEKLEAEIYLLNSDIKALNDEKMVCNKKIQFLDAFQNITENKISEKISVEFVDVAKIQDTFSFLGTNYEDVYGRLRDIDVILLDKNKELDMLKRQLKQFSGISDKSVCDILIDLAAGIESDAVLKVSYLVGGVSWSPEYDLRADIANAKVGLTAYGVITQNTGEDWDDVNVTLSTARPSMNNAFPNINPWILRPRVLARKGYRAVAKAQAVESELMFEDSTVSADKFGAEINKKTKIVEQGVAVAYVLPDKVDIKTGNDKNKYLIAEQILDGLFLYSAYPKAAANAYLMCKLTNSGKSQYRYGPANLFISDNYVGKTYLPNMGTDQETSVYFGADERVKVEKIELARNVDDTFIAGIKSQKVRLNLKYKLKVENYNPEEINIELFDTIPVSEQDDIKIKIDMITDEPAEKEWEDKKGVWRWNFKLLPGKEKTIEYDLLIEYPRSMDIGVF
ncbi:MAG: mucoidy inhibitor MuiA family protein [Candidatus Omnitrophica bacterium]|nr:mucoidy inhibitor MuiA family protein [Candidatus Omnitrophota bacterium]MDD5080635.1 mucoidy inhibitor MuiA family protein [Candidatus Omnitrophota bacterium]MDD5440838.1 mucoidy inhibitor MuiA family protein [Candidatus Omnitrophota bacterium]